MNKKNNNIDNVELTNNIISGMEKVIKKNFFKRYVDINDESVSATNIFLLVITIIGLILLLVPAIVLLIEVCYNHTISTDLSGMAAYIGAVVGLFATGGITKAWTNWSKYKYRKDDKKNNSNQNDDSSEGPLEIN